MSLRLKIFLFAGLVSILPLLILGWFWLGVMEEDLRHKTFKELNSINTLNTTLLREWTSGSLSLLESLAQRPLVIRDTKNLLKDKSSLTNMLLQKNLLDFHFLPALNMQDNLEDLSIIDLSGEVIVSTNATLVGQFRDDRPFFIHGQLESFVDTVNFSASSGQAVMHVATPLRDENQQTIAVISGHLAWQRASELLSIASSNDSTIESYLVNRHHFMLTQSKFIEDAPLKVTVATEGLRMCLESEGGQGVYNDYRGVPVLGVSAWLPERAVCMITEQDVAELIIPIESLKKQFYGAILTIAGFGLALAFLLTGAIIRPVTALAEGVRKSFRSGTPEPLEIPNNELGNIARAFNENLAARQTAEEENQRLIAILENAPQFVSLANPDGQVNYLNHAGREWLGLPLDKEPQFSIPEVHPEWAAKKILEEAIPHAEQHGPWIGETAFKKTDGAERPAMQVVMAHREPNGEISYYSTIAFDLSEQKALEDELKQHQLNLQDLVEVRTKALEHERKKLTSVFDSMEDIIYVADPESYELVYVNPAFETIWGKDVIGRKCHEVLQEESLPCSFCSNEKIFGENLGQTYIWEFCNQVNNNWFRCRDKAIEWVDGRWVRFEQATNITESKLAEQALRISEEKFRAYFENAQIGMAITSLNKGWEETNDRLCEILGYSHEELKQRTWIDLTHPDDLEPDLAEFKKLLDGTQDSYSREKRFIHKDKHVVYTLLSVACVRKEDGSPDYFAATLQDISQRKTAEKKLITATRQLTASNRELEQFAYVASHDLQEPLRTITSYLQLLERRYREQLDDDGKEFIDYTVQASSRMKALINDLLEFSRVGRKNTSRQPVDLNKTLEQFIAQNQILIKETETILTCGPLPTIHAVPSQMGQLFQNLIGNAIKFRRDDVTPSITISCEEMEDQWQIKITDNGIGIEKEYYEKIFTIFQRLHTMTQYPGTGIGLALCKRIVETHGGTIQIESAPGEGSTFTISLPKEKTHDI